MVIVVLGKDFLDELIIFLSCNDIQINIMVEYECSIAHSIVHVDLCPLSLEPEWMEAATYQMNHGSKHPHHEGPSPSP